MNRCATTIAKIVSCLLAITAAGCDERVAEVAREAADRQAEQNRTMAELHEEGAAGTRSLVEADGQARRELLAAGRELHVERSRLDEGRDTLDLDRKQFAEERRTDSLLVPVLQSLAAIALAVVVIGFSWFALVQLRSDEGGDAELVEFLIQELADNRLPDVPKSSAALLPSSRPEKRLGHESLPASNSTETK